MKPWVPEGKNYRKLVGGMSLYNAESDSTEAPVWGEAVDYTEKGSPSGILNGNTRALGGWGYDEDQERQTAKKEAHLK